MSLQVQRAGKGLYLQGWIKAGISCLFLSLFSVARVAGAWTGTDIGSVGVTGTDSYNSGTGVYTIAGSGADINGTADAGHFVYQTLTGDGELIARVASIQNTNALAKAGVMVRQSTAAGSINAFMAVTPTSGILSQQRTALNGTTASATTTASTAPYWLKIIKDGTLVSVYQAPDGVTWTYEGATRLSSLTSPVDIGFAVTSHSNTVLCTATFDNITLSTATSYAPTLPWHDQDIGSPGQAGQVHVEQYFWSLYGGGTGIAGTADSFHYAYQALSGNGVATALVNGLSTSTASAGVVMRQDLTAGSAEASVLLNFTNGIGFATRASAGATVSSVAGAHVAAPYWVKLVRLGNVFSGYQSSDGKTWTLVGSQTITMTGTIYVGVGATSGNNSTLALAALDGVYLIPSGNYLSTGGISSGANFNLYLQSTGAVSAWGLNTNGQIGDGTTTQRTSPVSLATLSGMETVSAGASHSLALKNDGTVWVWGLNTNGQLGDGTTTQRTSPFQLTTLSGIVAISAGASHSLALKNDGTVWVWGLNTNGQLGDGTTTQRTSPFQLTTLSGIVAISAGGSHSMALRDDGAVFAWGKNTTGQIGDGTTTQRTSPVQVTGVSDVAGISAGTSHSLVVGDDGSVWAWGDNSSGEIGDGTTTQRTSPVHVTSLSGMIAVQASNLFSVALKNDGTVWTWGKNASGQLGNNTTTQQNSPVQASGLAGAVAISAGTSHSAAITSDSAIWTWGANTNGQLGNGTTTASLVPQSLKPAITSALTKTGTTGVAFSYTITATSNPTSFSETGALPAGLSLSGAVISGTPTATGTFPITINATNLSGTGSATLTITINPPAPVITSATTAGGTTGVAFSYTITASNSPTSFSETGTLPAGLSLSGAVISGTPTATGTFPITIKATNAGGTGSATLTITINPPAPVITSALTKTGTTGVAFSYTITATNSPTSYSETGTLPAGLSLSGAVISGTPTATGVTSITIKATNAGGTGSATLTITINPPAPVITSPTTATGTTGVAFSYTITASNSPTSYSETGTLPAGLSLSGAVISGTPTATGATSITIKATNAGGTGSATLTITINPPAPVITSATTATGTTGVAFSYTITASNSPTSYSETGTLPAGLSLSGAVISGTPTATGATSITIKATNAGGTGSATLTITINPPPPVISSASTQIGLTGAAFSYTIAASNTPTSFNATGLPTGLSINTGTGVISGTPTAAGTSTVALSATNASGTGTANLTITLNTPPAGASGLTVWFKADAGVTQDGSGNVSQWIDQAEGNVVTQGTLPNEPSFVASDSNSVPGLRFNGSSFLANTASLGTALNADMTIVTVASTTQPGSGEYAVWLGGGGANTVRSFGYSGSTQFFDFCSNAVYGGAAPAANTFTVEMASLNPTGTSVSFYRNGAATGTATVSGVQNLTDGMTVGALIGGGACWQGDISEVLVYNHQLNSTEMQQVGVYLADRYGIYNPNATWIGSYAPAVQAEINLHRWNKNQADAYVAFQAANPTMLTNGLTVWFNAGAGITKDGSGNVSQWIDQAEGNVVTQNTLANEPSFVASDSSGTPGLRFNGSSFLASTSSLGTGLNADMTIVTVASTTQPASGEYAVWLGGGGANTVRSIGYGGSTQFFDFCANAVYGGAAPAANTFNVEMASLNSTGTSVSFYRNGAATGTATVSGVQNLTSGMTVGALTGGGACWQGDISEVLVYDHQLSAAELQQVGVYLADKYGVYNPNAAWVQAYSAAIQAQIAANQWNRVQASAYAAFVATNPPVPAPGLSLWFKADAGVTADGGGNVSQWQDQGPTMHLATQSTGANEPQATTDSTTGKQTLHFSGNQWLSSTDQIPANQDVTIITVAEADNRQNFGESIALGLNVTGADMRGYGYQNGQALFDTYNNNALVGAAPSSGQSTVATVTFTRSTGDVEFYSQGASNGNWNLGINDLKSGFVVGQAGWGGADWLGNISEVLVYNRVLTAAERNQAEGYLSDKYGIYTANATWPQAYSSAVQTEIARNQWTKVQTDAYVAFQAANSNMLTTGLEAWFKADAGVTTSGGNVTSWTDQTGNHTVTQGTAANQPTLVNNDSNGQPALRFGGNQWLYSPNNAGPGANADMTMITVAMTTTPSAQQASVYLGDGTGGAARTMGYDIDAQYFDLWGGFCMGAGAPNAGAFVAEETTLDLTRTGVTFYRNGSLTGIGSVSGALDTTAGITIGAAINQSIIPWNGDIAEVLVYDHQLSSAELQQVNTYLANKYGLYIPGATWINSYSAAVQAEINLHQWNKSQADAYVAFQGANPSMLTNGLTVWLKADAGITKDGSGNVSQWVDQAEGNAVTQNTLANEPSFVASDSNGMPGLHFNGSSSLASLANLGAGLGSDMTIVTVASSSQPQNTTEYALWLGNGAGSGGRSLGYGSSLQFFDCYGNGVHGGAAPVANTFNVEMATLNSARTSVAFYRNGTATGTGTLSGVQNLTNGMTVGSLVNGGGNWQGDICEVLVYDHQLSTTELQQVEVYLANKYATNSPAPAITSASTASGGVGIAFNYPITATNMPTSFAAAGLPAGLSVNTGTGLISGTPTTAGTSTVTLGATNGWGTGTKNLTLTINPPPPVISSAATASGTINAAFTYPITASNSPTSFGATGLPAGLSINTGTGLISGTPTATGISTVTLSATNAGGTGTATLTLTINPSQAPVISSPATASGTTGVAFSYPITASNSPANFGATGLPGGLSINTGTGVISGTPTATGVSTVTLSATNVIGTGTQTLTLTINPPAPVITSASSASGNVTAPFSYPIAATNSPTSYGATGLPAGLSINTGTGVISGTPTATGTSTVTLSASNAGGTGTATLTLTINPAQLPVISSAGSASGNVGTAFSYTITASNTPTSFGAAGLPGGLSINTGTGVISGTPTATGVSTVTLSATNTWGTGTQTLTLTINPPAPVISSAATVSGTINAAFTYPITASNSPTSFGATGLPGGLTVNTGTGVISGTPTATGTSTVTLSATNASGTGTQSLTLTVNPPAPVIGSATTTFGTIGLGFSYAITASNTPTSFGATGLPGGLTINTGTGVISGTPTATGASTVTLSATNAGGTGTASLTLTISPALPVTSGLAAWFKADTGVVATLGSVTQWSDLSSNQYNITQAVGSNAPGVTTDPASGLPVVAFNGSQYLNSNAQLFGVNDVTIITVASAANPNNSGTQVIVGTASNSAARALAYDGNKESFNNGTTSGDGGIVPANILLNINSMTYSQSGGTASFYSQGMANGTASIGSSALNSGLTLGSILNYIPWDAWNGNMAEIIIYNRVLSTTERQQIESYLANRYGLYAPGAGWIAGYATAVQAEINLHQWNKSQADAYVALQAANPSILTNGLTVWFKADAGITKDGSGNVSQWIDQAEGNIVIQSTLANEPSFVASDSNGTPGLHFTGSSTLASSAGLGVGLNADMTIVTVASTSQPQNTTEYAMWLGNGAGSTGRSLGYGSSLQFFDCYGNGVHGGAAPVANTFNVEMASLNSTRTSVSFYRNGTATGTGTLSGVQNLTSGMTVGSLVGGGDNWQGDISEVLVYDHQLSSTEIQQVSLYCANKYGIYNSSATWPSSYSAGVQSMIAANHWSKAQADAYVAFLQTTQMPVDNGICAWFSSNSGATTDSSGNMTQWTDQTFNHYTLTPNPYYYGTIPQLVPLGPGGQKQVLFNGGWMSSGAQISANDVTIMTVASAVPPLPSESGALVYLGKTWNGNTARGAGYDQGKQSFLTGEPNGYFTYNDGNLAPQTANLVFNTVTYNASTGAANFYSQGQPNGSTTATASPLSAGISIGPWTGDVVEVVIFNRVLSDTERLQMENYLANRDGLYYPGAAWISSYSQSMQATINQFQLTKAQADVYAAFAQNNPQIPSVGLTFWTKADAGVTSDGSGNVSQWQDQSPMGLNAAQSTASAQPLLVNNAMNGKPVIRFNGSSQYLSIPPGITNLDAGITTFTVFTPNSPANGARIFDIKSNTFDDFGLACDTVTNTANAVAYETNNGNQESVEGFNDMINGGPQEYTVLQTENAGSELLNVYTSGSLVGGAYVGSIYDPLSGYYYNQLGGVMGIANFFYFEPLGNVFSGANYIGKGAEGSPFHGDIAELLVYNRPLSMAERQQVESYLAGKYSLYAPGASWIAAYPSDIQKRIAQNRWSKAQADAYVSAYATIVANNPGILTSGLSVWLKADAGVTSSSGSVSQWTDQISGNVLAQTTTASQPQLIASDLNGKPGLRFNGSNYLTAAVSNQLNFKLNSDISIITVGMTTQAFNPSNPQFGCSVWLGGPSNTNSRSVARGTNVQTTHVTPSFGNPLGEVYTYTYVDAFSIGINALLGNYPPAAGSFAIEAATLDPTLTVADFYQNGVLSSASGSSNLNANTVLRYLSPGITVGAEPEHGAPPANFWQGDINEILVYDHQLSPAELQQVTVYLANKYGITYGSFPYQSPTISPNGGIAASSINVSFSAAPTGTTIHYTLDGTTPSASSPLYSGAFNLTASHPVQCALFQGPLQVSAVSTAQFYVADSGNTGLSDAWQMLYFGHTGVDPNAMSPGGSGLTNLQDYLYGYNPNLYSTNGDGFSDYVNYTLGIAATNTSLAADGLTNLQQLALGLNVFSPEAPIPPPTPPTPNPNDHTPPVITLFDPPGAQLIP